MIDVDKLGARLILGINFGNVTIEISESALWGIIAAVLLALLGIWLGSGLKKIPTGKQVIAEALVGFVYNLTEKNIDKKYTERYGPIVGTIMMYVFVTSAFGLFGQRPITADINVTGALAAFSFLVIQIEGVRCRGAGPRLKSFFEPYFFMFPIKIIENITLPVTLALRLFGNIFGGMIVIELWMHLMEFISHMVSSIPFMRAVFVLPLNAFFDIFEPAIQTYVFTMLTMLNLKTAITGESGGDTGEKGSKKDKKKRRKSKRKSKRNAAHEEAVPAETLYAGGNETA